MHSIKNTTITLFFPLILAFGAFGQVNLVPNFGFENFSNCPNTEDQVDFCNGWSKYSSPSTTPDYYNACVPGNNWGDVPQNTGFYQLDHRNCGAYIGLVTWLYNTPNYREHIGTQLTQPMVIGQKYFISFNAVLALQDDYITPANNIGVKLSTTSYSDINPAPIDNVTQLRSVSVITDTVNWIHISGSITADSAYNYLSLGNFFDDANTDTLTQICGTCQNWYSYYLIDDICISTDSSYCNGGIDLLPCNVGIDEVGVNELFEVYPNPAENFIAISSPEDLNYNVLLLNSLGELIYQEENIVSNYIQLDIADRSSGVYFVKIITDNNQHVYKILKP